MVTGFLEFIIESDGVCKEFLLGNKAKETFPSNETRSKSVLDLVNFDISSLMPVDFMLGCSYL